jgi:hypothetical protein
MLRGAREACVIQCKHTLTNPEVEVPEGNFGGACRQGCATLNVSAFEVPGTLWDNKQVFILRATRIGCYETCQEVLADLYEQSAAAEDCDAVCHGLSVGDRFGLVVTMSKAACKSQCEEPWTEVPDVSYDDDECTRDCGGELHIPASTSLGIY